jgi:hypothetical protein
MGNWVISEGRANEIITTVKAIVLGILPSISQ